MPSSRRLLLTSSLLLAASGATAFAPEAPTRTSSRPCIRPSSTSTSMVPDRRDFLTDLSKAATGALLVGFTGTAANALDFDAFEKGEIKSDTDKCDPKRDPKCVPKLTKDEALCQYGGGGQARGDACMRVRKAGGALPEVKKEKSLGGAYAM
ncbi:hypothetical protein ACHAWF_007504 [Thalassiosira exigua]